MTKGATKLELVSTSQLPNPPYPPDTLSRGWRFEVDGQKVFRSSTWRRTPVEIRPWLLLIWLVSWQSEPCGTLEPDDDAIAGAIGMPPNLFAMHRANLMSKWVLHSDGRLYHPEITVTVFRMEAARAKEANRKAEWRAKKRTSENQPLNPPVPRDTHGTPTGLTALELELVGKAFNQAPPSTFVDTVVRPERPRTPPCPVERLIEGWNSICAPAGCVRFKVATKARTASIAAAWRKLFDDGAVSTELEALQFFHRLFNRIAASKFLTGRTPPGAGHSKPHRAELATMMQPEKFAALIEGRYD